MLRYHFVLVVVFFLLVPFVPFVPVVDDCVVEAPWFSVEVEPTSVDDWLADTELFTDWLPLPVLTPGLIFAPAFTSELAIPTFASTPTFGFTFVALLPESEPLPEVVEDDCALVAPWFIDEVEPMSVDDWFAVTPLLTVWLPLPRFTPGEMLAPRFTSVLLTPTLALTPTFGFTLREEPDVLLLLGLVPDVLPDEVPLVPPSELDEPVLPLVPLVEPLAPVDEPIAPAEPVVPRVEPVVLPVVEPVVLPVVEPGVLPVVEPVVLPVEPVEPVMPPVLEPEPDEPVVVPVPVALSGMQSM
jgi:hypothetical protein